MKLIYERIETDLVTLHCFAEPEVLVGIFFGTNLDDRLALGDFAPVDHDGSNRVLISLKQQIKDYFEGARKTFDVPLKLSGSELQLAAWRQISQIPFGQTLSYAAQARAMGRPKVVRAIASANGQNRFPLIIPCHRVLRSDGSIGGYSGGAALKAKLLELEAGRLFD